MVPITSRPMFMPDLKRVEKAGACDFSLTSQSEEAMDMATSMMAPMAPMRTAAKIMAFKSIDT
ncbi:hypothetical protein SDC9_120958 [bioreactor metagenome]|uniref:Uncharacterized protein n=1 Tax=bioreactor metagenome TaxID=1076179 RepID=A0A645CAL6_9ZZZZ